MKETITIEGVTFTKEGWGHLSSDAPKKSQIEALLKASEKEVCFPSKAVNGLYHMLPAEVADSSFIRFDHGRGPMYLRNKIYIEEYLNSL